MEAYQKLLLENKAWAKEIKKYNPNYFKNLAKCQTPDFLWIGCSDSRAPANEITNTAPGEVFVHRNIANLVVKDDKNLLSVLKFAVEVLKVPHVILCGHYDCGGVQAAMNGVEKPLGLGVLEEWIDDIKQVYRKNAKILEAIPEKNDRLRLLVELNIRQQVHNLAQTETIKNRWAEHGQPILHGWVYGLHDGLIKELITLSATNPAETPNNDSTEKKENTTSSHTPSTPST